MGDSPCSPAAWSSRNSHPLRVSVAHLLPPCYQKSFSINFPLDLPFPWRYEPLYTTYYQGNLIRNDTYPHTGSFAAKNSPTVSPYHLVRHYSPAILNSPVHFESGVTTASNLVSHNLSCSYSSNGDLHYSAPGRPLSYNTPKP